jgi:hypothetical protein
MKSALVCINVTLFCCLVCALAGCGSSTVGLTSTSGAAGLKGNWLLAGTLPVFAPGSVSQNFGLALTLDVIDGQVFAQSSDFYPCSNGSAAGGSGGLTPAAIASDGSFALQTTQLNGVTPTIVLSIHGTVPEAVGGSWSGTYSASNSNVGCAPIAGTFSAVPIQRVSGTFSGTGSLGPPSSGFSPPVTPAPIMLTTVLQQGGPASLDLPVGSSPVNSVSALSGTISVKGSTCFSSGTAKIPSGSVFGSRIEAQFTMDDGSTLLLNGTIMDAATSTIAVTSILIEGGTCNRWFGSGGANLVRQ